MQGMIAAAAFGVVPAVVIGIVATLVLAWAWHGRQVDEHAMCRDCGFGLNGRTRLMLPTCPDCGADLERPRAIRFGRRRRRPALLAASACLILGSTAWVTFATWAQVQGIDLIYHTPTSWLVADADGHDPRARNAALAELARRVSRGQLSGAREKALVEQALAYQADWSRPWVSGWGDVIEAARVAGRASDQQWARYQVQSVSLALEPQKSTLRRSDHLVMQLFRGPDRVGSRRASFDLFVEAEPGVSIAGRQVDGEHKVLDPLIAVPDPQARDKSTGAKLATTTPINLQRLPALDRLPGGEHAVKLGVTIRPARVDGATTDPAYSFTVLPGGRRVEVAGRFQLRDEGQALDALVGPEWKGVWVPPEKREALLRSAAKRKEARTGKVGQPAVGP